MYKKLILLAVILILITGVIFVLRGSQKSSLQKPSLNTFTKEVQPSETFIEYSDPSGFAFSYPDNLSITKGETDENTYADLQLFSKEVNGSLSFKVSDSKFKTLDEWVNLNKGEVRQVNLGTLKATEIETSDRLLLGALDQGIFFTIEMPLIEEAFWMKVYSKILSDFSFVAPQVEADSSSEVVFEGEEVVE
ncbi:MAG: PsbP-related protein [Patescibacteria group bacterium]